MKLSLPLFLSLVGGAAAFVPTSKSAAATTAVGMSEDVPLLEIKEPVPCFPATPMGGEFPVFFGENYWNKLTSEYGSEDTGIFIQAAEIKHGRAAMMATVGFAFHKLGLTLDNISPRTSFVIHLLLLSVCACVCVIIPRFFYMVLDAMRLLVLVY